MEWALEVGFLKTFVIFIFHGPRWVFLKILMVKAITLSILVRFSKFLCLNISAFQDLSFSFTEHPRGTCPSGQKRVLKLVHENKNHKIWKKWSSRSHSIDFFLQVNWKVFWQLKFEIWGLSDQNEKSYDSWFGLATAASGGL